MSDFTTDDICRKVRGLLDKAEATPFPEEAEALSEKAMEMMAQHRIDLAMLEASRPRQDRGKVIERDVLLGSGPYVRARLALIVKVADASYAKVLTSVGFEGRIAHVIGYENDVADVEVLYTSLLAQATGAVQAVRGVANRRTFLFAFTERIASRLHEINAAAEASVATGDGPGVAIVLADRRADVKADIDRRYGRVRTLGRAASLSGSASAIIAGREAGNRADIGTGNRVAGARKALG